MVSNPEVEIAKRKPDNGALLDLRANPRIIFRS